MQLQIQKKQKVQVQNGQKNQTPDRPQKLSEKSSDDHKKSNLDEENQSTTQQVELRTQEDMDVYQILKNQSSKTIQIGEDHQALIPEINQDPQFSHYLERILNKCVWNKQRISQQQYAEFKEFILENFGLNQIDVDDFTELIRIHNYDVDGAKDFVRQQFTKLKKYFIKKTLSTRSSKIIQNNSSNFMEVIKEF